jgi:hypothetical protein
VLAHKNPAQVARLVRRLATDQAMFLVHVDRRARGVEGELRTELAGLPDVAFLERRRCYWGGFGMVRATLGALNELGRRNARFDHALVLSGQDYPLRSAAGIELFLGGNLDRSFITADRLPNHWPGGGLPRIERWHLVSPVVLHLPVPWRRRLPHGLVPYGGGAWICLSRPVVEYVTEFVRSNPSIVRFFEHALHPDELFFQTIVMNSPLAETVVDDHLRYIDWSTDPAPAILRASDFERLIQSGRIFARKFDVTADATVLDRLDAYLTTEAVASAG